MPLAQTPTFPGDRHVALLGQYLGMEQLEDEKSSMEKPLNHALLELQVLRTTVSYGDDQRQ